MIYRICSSILLCLLLSACASNQGRTDLGLGIQPGFNTPGLSKDAVLRHQSVFFDFNKTDVKSQYLNVIEAHANYLAAHPKQTVLLTGNTDVRGSRTFNLALGQSRAGNVADILLANGVAAKQLVKVSYGAEVPLACNNSKEAYAINRRVDILYCKTSNCKQVAQHYGQTICSFNQ